MATFLILLPSLNILIKSITLKTNEVLLISLDLIRTNRDYVRKARPAHLIDEGMTLEPRGINRRDELS